MTAAAIVTLFSGLSAASSGAHGSIGGMLSMLAAMRYFYTYHRSKSTVLTFA